MNQSHLDMDDMGLWAESHPMTRRTHLVEAERLEAERMEKLNADYTKADRNESALYAAPQGRESQGWRIRPGNIDEMACWAPDDDDRRDELTPAEAWLLLAIFCLSAVFVGWLLTTLAKALT